MLGVSQGSTSTLLHKAAKLFSTSAAGKCQRKTWAEASRGSLWRRSDPCMPAVFMLQYPASRSWPHVCDSQGFESWWWKKTSSSHSHLNPLAFIASNSAAALPPWASSAHAAERIVADLLLTHSFAIDFFFFPGIGILERHKGKTGGKPESETQKWSR